MSDVLTKKKRSQVMARIRARGNKVTELVLVRLLRFHKLTGWRRHACLPGKPDFTFYQQRLTVFVDGCFWHGCEKHCRMPTSNQSYWQPKIARNKTRDKAITTTLRKRGWRVLRIWEHELAARPEQCVNRIKRYLL